MLGHGVDDLLPPAPDLGLVLALEGLAVPLAAALLPAGCHGDELVVEAAGPGPNSDRRPKAMAITMWDTKDQMDASAAVARAMIGELKDLLRAPPQATEWNVMFNAQP